MNILLNLTFNGTNYFGWQSQPGGNTVQQAVEAAISAISGVPADVQGCSRTDSGVHALEYVCNFHTAGETFASQSGAAIPLDKLPAALNANLPRDIAINFAEAVDDDFRSRYSVTRKTYAYNILNSRTRNPFLRGFSWRVPYPLDIEAMQECCSRLTGTHDFKAFMSSTTDPPANTVRTVYHCSAEPSPDAPNLLIFTVTANAFLYNMVRIMVGTTVMAGSGKIDPKTIPLIIESGDRKLAGVTAPPTGLFLKKVTL